MAGRAGAEVEIHISFLISENVGASGDNVMGQIHQSVSSSINEDENSMFGDDSDFFRRHLM
jgi:hypothetical protein